jgi:hypothetical protein
MRAAVSCAASFVVYQESSQGDSPGGLRSPPDTSGSGHCVVAIDLAASCGGCRPVWGCPGNPNCPPCVRLAVEIQYL